MPDKQSGYDRFFVFFRQLQLTNEHHSQKNKYRQEKIECRNAIHTCVVQLGQMKHRYRYGKEKNNYTNIAQRMKSL